MVTMVLYSHSVSNTFSILPFVIVEGLLRTKCRTSLSESCELYNAFNIFTDSWLSTAPIDRHVRHDTTDKSDCGENPEYPQYHFVPKDHQSLAVVQKDIVEAVV
jgi:hypothetical protein